MGPEHCHAGIGGRMGTCRWYRAGYVSTHQGTTTVHKGVIVAVQGLGLGTVREAESRVTGVIKGGVTFPGAVTVF